MEPDYIDPLTYYSRKVTELELELAATRKDCDYYRDRMFFYADRLLSDEEAQA